MKLLIADDEPKIRNGLAHHFSGNSFGFDTVETAENGSVALEKALTLAPDVILVDICMPKMNGFEFLTEVLHQIGPCKIVIISGHDDFLYAQKAIQIGARDYVLKPIELSRLELLVRDLCHELTFEHTRQKTLRLLQNTIEKNRAQLINTLFGQILRNDINGEDIEEKLALLHVTMPDPAGMVVMRVVEKCPENTSDWELDLLWYAVSNIAHELYSSLQNKIFFADGKQHMTLLFSYCEGVDYNILQATLCESIKLHIGYTVEAETVMMKNTCLFLRETYRQVIHTLTSIHTFSTPVLRAKNYIEQFYYREDTVLQTVAGAIQINAAYLSRLMHKQLGMSFVDYLTSYRMQKAVLLLQTCEKDMRLYEIAQKLGYSSQHYFCRLFKKYYGMSPQQYRMEGVSTIA
ncbi:MAG: response regulator [Oscillospiraceae bacterium]|jgi:two-component system response regulator YesN|nr:response regulator [Oscillospiraceae bacterium]